MREVKKTFAISLLTFSLLVSFGLRSSAQIKPSSGSTLPTATSSLPVVSHGSSDKVNYVRTFDFYKAMTSTTNLSTEIGANNVMQATQYLDGLGRPIQTVARKASGSGKDLVTFMTYDEYGRQVYAPMPYVATGSTNGALQLTPSASQESFLGGHYPGEDIFYSKTSYEASPLNRVLKQIGPGNSWTAANSGAGAGVSMQYLTNTSGEGVRLWTVGTGNPTSTDYLAAELTELVTTDENGNQVKEFTNGRGQVVLKQVQKAASTAEAHGNWLSTYYLYDDYGNLRYVLPPRAVELLYSGGNNWSWTGAGMQDLIFSYTYDGRNRMITKKVPGAEEVHMVYDRLDRLVLTQDANQRASIENQWTFTKYDPLGRPVLTGFITSTSDRAAMQLIADGWTGEMHVKREGLSSANVVEGATVTVSNRDTSIDTYRTKTTGYIDFLPGMESETGAVFDSEIVPSLSHEYIFYEGYHDATFPQLASYTNHYKVNTINYYDDYDFTSKTWSSDYNGFYSTNQGTTNAEVPVQDTNVKGMATGSKVRVLDTDDYLTTVMFYDDRGRVIQTQGENHLGGTDISTTQYDFAGRVLHTYTKHSNPQSSANSTTRILKEFAYDHVGRLLTIKEKLDSASTYKTLVTHTYNELGELESKVLGSGLETLDYDYNVRGWLKSINGDYIAGTDNNHYFGMDLSYDYGFSENQYNGNIAGVKWKSKSSDELRAYGFDYDAVNRLTKADYTQGSGWTNTTSDFSTSYGYDANGNILNLMRKGTIAGTITTIDQLTYDYGSGFNAAGTGNRLTGVRDTAGDLGQGDFKDGNTSGDDYQYDLNGNMKDDMNKGITNITYNHLNLPVTVSFGSTKTISYTYDAAGIKLQKQVNDNGNITVTDYAGGFIYEDNELQHFGHEEGRVRKNKDGQLVYDYFVKDHLGNTRMTLTETPDVIEYRATMEVGTNSSGVVMDDYEESLFLLMDNVRDNSVSTANTTNVPGIADSYTARLNGTVPGRRVGPGKMLVVSPGDQISVSVDSYHTGSYTDNGDQGQATMVSAIAGLFGGQSGAGGQEGALFDLFNGASVAPVAYVGTSGSTTRPRAYLNVLVFDQDFNLLSAQSTFKQTDQASGFKPLNHSVSLSKGGFVYVYLSNESQTDFEVHFDNLAITHTKGNILQEDHYYPFGMSISALSSSAPLSTPNNFKYNSFEEQTDFDLGWYDYQARFYDPQLGRFNQVDPAAGFMRRHSPYNYAFDNPIRFIDPDGMVPTEGGQCPDGNCKEGEGSASHQQQIKEGNKKCETGDCSYEVGTWLETTNNGKGKVGAHIGKLDIRNKEGNIDVKFSGSLGEVSAEAKLSSGFYGSSSEEGGNKGKVAIAGSASAEATLIQLGLDTKVGAGGVNVNAKVLGAKAEITGELSQNAIGIKGEAMAYVGKAEGGFSYEFLGVKVGVQAEVYEGAVGAGGEAIVNFREAKGSFGLKGSLFFGGGVKVKVDISKWFQ